MTQKSSFDVNVGRSLKTADIGENYKNKFPPFQTRPKGVGPNALTDLSQISASSASHEEKLFEKMEKDTEFSGGCIMDDIEIDVIFETDIRGYLYEPKCSDEQLRSMEEQEAAEAAATTADLPAADEEPTIARAGADWWCLCSHFAPMDTEQESVCCRESQRCQFLIEEIMESEDDTDVCVVAHPSFAPHIDSGVLETYFSIPKVNWKRQPKPTGSNGRLSIKQFRLTAYRHFLEWVLQGERLGRGNRVVLPACVVLAIRHKYPAPDGNYCWHQEAEDAQEEL